MLRALLLAALLLLVAAPAAAQTATPTPTATPPTCATASAPTSTPSPSYQQKVLSYTPFAFWPLNEAAGTVAIDATGNGRHGTYSGVTLNATTFTNGDRAVSLDGVNDYINIFSAINGVFNGSEGTIAGWAKANSTVWSDSANNRLFNVQATPIIRLGSSSAVNNALSFESHGKIFSFSTTSTDWFHFALTWSISNDRVNFYVDGSLVNSQSTVSAWSGSLNSAANVLGATNTSGVSSWLGNMSNVAMWDTALGGFAVSDLAIVSAPAPTATATVVCVPFVPTPTRDPVAWITIAPLSSTTPQGQMTRFDYVVSAGDVQTGNLLTWLLYSLWGMFLFGILVVLARYRK